MGRKVTKFNSKGGDIKGIGCRPRSKPILFIFTFYLRKYVHQIFLNITHIDLKKLAGIQLEGWKSLYRVY